MMAHLIGRLNQRETTWEDQPTQYECDGAIRKIIDDMGHQVAELLIQPSAARSRLIAGMYLPRSESDLMGKLEAAMHAVIAAEPIDAKVRAAKKAGRLSGHGADAQYEEAMKLSVITETELALWKRARVLQHDIIMVDDFDLHFGKQASSAPPVWREAKAAE